MTKITKMGIICNMVAEMCHNLSQAQSNTNSYEETRNHEYYFRSRGLDYCLLSMGINCTYMTKYLNGRTYIIGVAISDGTKGSPTFADMAYYVIPFGSPVNDLYSEFVIQCERDGYDYIAMKKEIRKIYGCK